MGTILYVTAEAVRRLTIAASAFVPAGGAKILDLLAIPEEQRFLSCANDEYKLVAGTELPAPTPVFARIERDAS